MRSARSARAFIGSAPIFLCTDQQAPSDAFDVVFTIQHPTYSFVDKINGLLSFRSQHGIFLDTDTFVCGDLTNIFDLLQQFDIAVAHASWRFSPRVKDGTVVEPSFRNAPIPDSFPDFNTGVIAFRNTPAVNDVFKNWYAIYNRQCRDPLGQPANDQPAFTEAIWNSTLRVYVLPPEFNCRADFPVYVGTNVRIYHGRHGSAEDISDLINSGIGARVFVPEVNRVFDSRSFTFVKNICGDV